MTKLRINGGLTALMLAAALALTGCGDSDGPGDSTAVREIDTDPTGDDRAAAATGDATAEDETTESDPPTAATEPTDDATAEDTGAAADDTTSADEATTEDDAPVDGDAAEFCAVWKDAEQAFGGGTNFDGQMMQDLMDTLDEMEADAPAEIKDDVAYMNEKFSSLETMLNDAGLEFTDLDDLGSGELPEGVDMTKLQNLVTEMEKLDLEGPEFQQHGEAITEFAEANC